MTIHLIVSCELPHNKLVFVPRTGSLHLIIIRTSFVALTISNKLFVLNNLKFIPISQGLMQLTITCYDSPKASYFLRKTHPSIEGPKHDHDLKSLRIQFSHQGSICNHAKAESQNYRFISGYPKQSRKIITAHHNLLW